MTAKEFLNRARGIDKRIRALKVLEEQERSNAERSCAYVGLEKVQTSPKNTRENSYITCADYVTEIEEKRKELIIVKKEIFDVISQVQNNTLNALLSFRYLSYKSWEEVAERIEYESVRWVRKNLHSQALKEVERILERRDKQ